jgi:hypothetical protein
VGEGVRDYVTIVAGVPRSGTSVAMQMLAAGGLEPLTDHVRQADEDNPRGYFEYEPVKHTKEDAGWLDAAAGKVVKMVYRLLYDLPEDRAYRVVLMKRDMREAVASQRKMLERLGRPAPPPDEQMAALLEKEVAACERWLAERANLEVVTVDYNRLVVDPVPAARRLAEFLGPGLDAEAMAAAVDPRLYRNRQRG